MRQASLVTTAPSSTGVLPARSHGSCMIEGNRFLLRLHVRCTS
jgi:hypothetical protein